MTALLAVVLVPTFYRDVLPVLQERCQTCHRPGEIGPMPLETYRQARPWAKAIREAVLSRRMPPWHADPGYGKFRNDLSLSAAEIQTLAAWADAGAPEGDPAEAPAPPRFAAGWRIAAPDAVFELPAEVRVPAAGTLEYQYYEVRTNFSEDRWVEMAEVRPTNRAVVHHAIVSTRGVDGDGRMSGQYLAGYAPGMSPQIWKPGQARLLPKGARIECTAWYDNSANNPRNPDPASEVRWGEQSWEEMMIGWFDVAVPNALR